jgi:hypothetical protein
MPKYSQHQLLVECEGSEYAALFQAQGSKMTEKTLEEANCTEPTLC